jgi:hypothetical protein
MSEDRKVTSIMPKLEEKQDYFDHMDMKCDMCGILRRAIQEMRERGATSKDIAATLHHAVGELLEDEP